MEDLKQAIITLGGLGTRLSSITKDLPKSLYPINGKHTLERAIEVLSSQGIKYFIWIIRKGDIRFKSEVKRLMNKYDIDIEIFFEPMPKGEAGSLFDMIDMLDDNFLFLNGDIIFDIDLKRLCKFHLNNSSELTFITHTTNHPFDSDCIIESPNLSIHSYKVKTEKEIQPGYYLGNAGISIISKMVLLSIKNQLNHENIKISFFKDIILKAKTKGFKVFSYNTSEYLKDMGTPSRLEKVKLDILNNIVETRSYRKQQKTLFLDRDNTIIDCMPNSYITSIKDISIKANRVKNLCKIAKEFDFVLIISNQPQISMGILTFQDVIKINGEVIRKCGELGLEISGSYFCPHHPHNGFNGEIENLKSSCFCRKPKPGLFLEAKYDKNINLQKSLMIGDSWRDLEAAKSINLDFKWAETLDSSSNK